MLVQRALNLILRRQMDIAIRQIDRRAVKDTIGHKLRPLRGGQDFESGVGVRHMVHAICIRKKPRDRQQIMASYVKYGMIVP
jgi:hypothetical protein